MVLRETTFEVGGALTIALGVLLGLGLFVSGAGVDYLDAWLAAALGVGFGAFFVSVGRSAGRERRRALDALEKSTPGDAPRPPER